jgi:predicted AAA+ superfamily ATPase
MRCIPNIGLKLKIIIDQIKDVQVIVSGSSAFDIKSDSRTIDGTQIEYHLYPISWSEFENSVGYMKATTARIAFIIRNVS